MMIAAAHWHNHTAFAGDVGALMGILIAVVIGGLVLNWFMTEWQQLDARQQERRDFEARVRAREDHGR